MKEIQLLLVPAPGAKPEFLATVQPVGETQDASTTWNAVGDKVVLEGYTRDGWAWKPSSDGTTWTTLTVESTDGRNKLPGFVNYLKERQKSAYGRLGTTGVWVVSYVQPKPDATAPHARVTVRIALNGTQIPNCTLEFKQKPSQPATSQTRSTKDTKPTAAPTPARKSGGLLGKLVGAQQRTNEYVAIAKSQPPARIQAASNGAASHTQSIDYKTVPEVFAAFRESCQAQMLDFDMSDEEVLKVPIHMKEQLQWLATDDEKSKVTMDVLKYMIYEAAEEVNDEWVAHKEPSEYMDEVVIAVYKEGAAPPEVLEEINKGELPDEIRGQQRALQEQRVRQSQRKSDTLAAPNLHDDEDDDLEALNTKKRDRRTVADYEREKMESAPKRSR